MPKSSTVRRPNSLSISRRKPRPNCMPRLSSGWSLNSRSSNRKMPIYPTNCMPPLRGYPRRQNALKTRYPRHWPAMGLVITALALTGCSSTNRPSVTVTPPLIVSACPVIPTALLQLPPRPATPRSGTPAALLAHASQYGQWSQALAHRLRAIQTWAAQQQARHHEQADR
ncbi:hypothetical protein D3790_09075 [Xenorhabdus nematophila]|nr:hypothetical protein D3790_09075 [Xenorhabdus nematophila]